MTTGTNIVTGRLQTLGLACLIVMALASWAVAQTAQYSVTFDATWSSITHPTDFPPSPHFSGLVGGTHDGTVSFWEEGQLSSLGMKRMAEWGSQTELLAEVQAAINLGQAEFTITDAPLWTVPGSTSVDISVTPEYSLVTLVAMIAPSPDWFIGVRNLDLAPGGIWAEELVVDLYAFDAGTDSGVGYTSGDVVTTPPDPIFQITGYPFTPGVPLGTLTFTKLYVSDVPDASALNFTAYPNPFNPRTTIAWELPADGPLKVVIHDAAGRLVNTLWDGFAYAGPGRTTWNGQDASGNNVGAGMYFARVIQGAAARSQKITLLK